MKRLLLILLCLPMIGFAQSVPQGINYQAVARDANSDILVNQVLTIQFSIISDITTSAISWQETHSVATNDYGLFTAIIGQGTSTGVGNSATFDVIDWGASNHLLKVEIDYGGGLVDMGTTAFLSVPYSMNASNVNPTDELQSLSLSGDTLFISNGNFVILPKPTLLGCTDSLAFNYNPLANTDDSSCVDKLFGCTSILAHNYDSLANVDDGSCIAKILGCTDTTADNYDAAATTNDGSCQYFGCIDPLACNYDSTANFDDGSCTYSFGCTDSLACNYDSKAVCDDGSCATIYGCTDPNFTEFISAANCDDGSCITFRPLTLVALQTAVDLWTSSHAQALSFYGPINNWDVSLITSMYHLFKNKTTFNDDISSWDVSNVQNMNSLFYSATSFNQDLSNWNVSNVTDMYSMFYNATSFNQDISNWNVSSVTNMNYMFSYAEVFNQDLSLWDVSSVTTMYEMFKRAYMFNQDISNWNVSNVQNMYSLFYGATSFNQDISSWNISPSSISQVTDMTYMFYNTPALSNLNKCLINNSFSPHPVWDPLYNTTPAPTYYEYFGECAGCIDSTSCNYNPVFLIDDGSCLYGVLGCIDSTACNYDSTATCDDGSCFGILGCIDSLSCNYDSKATCDDGSCLYGMSGCTDSIAINYDSTATCDDGSCIGIGDTYQGGIIFYLDGNGGGLIAAPTDQSNDQRFGCNGIAVGVCNTSIGDGYPNSLAIINNCGATAAQLCTDLVIGPYSDWFLPSLGELQLMYDNKSIIGNFSNDPYWSSSEDGCDPIITSTLYIPPQNSIYAQGIYFSNGSIFLGFKTGKNSVRAIRAF